MNLHKVLDHRSPLAGLPPLRALAPALLAAVGSAAAQGYRLNPELARPIGGDVQRFRLDATGSRAVYVADQEADDVFELFTARPVGGVMTLVKLNPTLPPGGDVLDDFQLAATGARVVYRADQELDQRFELFSVPVDGGVAVKLNAPLVAGGDVGQPGSRAFEISPDGTTVLYLADQQNDGRQELFAVPIDASAPPQKVNAPLVAAGDVTSSFRFSPDGQRVLYAATQDSATVVELFSAVLDGSRLPVQLNAPLVANGNVGPFEVSPDSAWVIYRADQVHDEEQELFSAAIDGGSPAVELSRIPGGARDVFTFAVAGTRAVYRADQDQPNVTELYSAPVDGSQPPVRLHPALVPGNSVLDFTLAPDGSRAAFMADSGDLSSFDLFSVPADGSAAPVRLNPPLPTLGTVFGGFRFTPSSARVVYQAEQDDDAVLELYSVRADGSAPAVKLSPPMTPGGNVSFGFALAADLAVVFKADADTDGVVELYAAAHAAGTAVKLNSPLVFGGDVDLGSFQIPDPSYQVSADGLRVAYLADEDADQTFELFGVPIDAMHAPVKLNPGLPIGPVEGDVSDYAVTADGQWAVYRADQAQDEVFELHRVSAVGASSFVRLSAALVAGGDVTSFALSPDGTLALYRADQDVDEVHELFVVPVDAGVPPLRLSAPLVAGGDVDEDYAFTPDGVRVVYRADQDQDGVGELYSVPSDGSAAPVELSGTPVAGGAVASGTFRISPDSARVVFAGDLVTDEMFELFSAPTDGSVPPVKLSGTMTGGGDVALWTQDAFEIAPLGGRVVYLADQEVDRQFELYSVPIDGSAGAVKLNGALVPGSSTGTPEIGSDGLRVVFSASQQSPDRSELYAAPIDGSTPALLLTPGLPANTNVLGDYRIAPLDLLVVYRADATTDGVPELFSVPIDASAEPVKLNGALVPGGSVRAVSASEPVFRASPDGLRVVYTANQDSSRLDLYVAPIDGSAPSLRLNRPVAEDVQSDFRFASGGAAVLYRADEAGTGPEELFRVPLVGGAAPRRVSAVGTRLVLDFVLSPKGERVVYRADEDGLGVQEIFLSFLGRPARDAASPTGTVTRSVP